MKTTCYVQSNIGTTRAANEDNYFCCGAWRKRLETPVEELLQTPEGESLLFAVFDGMGGETAGGQASLLCAETMEQERLAGGTFEAPAFYHRANTAVARLGQSLGGTSGSTAAVAHLRANRLFVSNVGDSRVYHLRGSALRCLTYDHTRYQMLVDSGYAVIDDSARHILTQFLGMGGSRPMSAHFAVSVPLEPGDRGLLCSDGVCGTLEDTAILEALQTDGGPENAGRALVNASLAAGSTDNVTVVVLDFLERDETPDPDAETQSDGPSTRRFDVPPAELIEAEERKAPEEKDSSESDHYRELRRSFWLVLLALVGILALAGGIVFLTLRFAPGEDDAPGESTPAVDASYDYWYDSDTQIVW